MAYAREKDLCLHESSLMTNENAKLAIEKQGDVVKCLTELTYVLSRGMLPPRASGGREPHAAPPNHEQHSTEAARAPPIIAQHMDYGTLGSVASIGTTESPDQ